MTQADMCFVIACMGRLAHLRRTLPRAVAQPDTSVVVVDYSCPERCGDWVSRTFPNVTVVSVPNQERYSASRARNAGLAAADADWVCMLDCDILLDPAFAETIRRLREPRSVLRAHPNSPTIFGTFVAQRRVIEEVGAFDDLLEGWGNHNGDLFARMQLAGVRQLDYPGHLVQHIDHDDDARTRFHEVSDRRANFTANRLYMMVKLDTLRMGGTLTSEYRAHVYRRIRQEVLPKLQAHEPADIEFGLSAERMLWGHNCGRFLRYRIDPPRS